MKESLILQSFEKNYHTSKKRMIVELSLVPGGLQLAYLVQGSIDDLLLPRPIKRPRYKEKLWEQSVFEVFLKSSDSNQPQYTEWNFSSSGDWWQMGFLDYRERNPAFSPQELLNPIQTEIRENLFILTVGIPIPRLPLDLSVAGILKHTDQSTSHWALKHPSQKPDFHSLSGFAHLLESPH